MQLSNHERSQLYSFNGEELKRLDREEKQRKSDAFWNQVDKDGDCWIWRGTSTVKGFCHFSYGSASCSAPRFALTDTGRTAPSSNHTARHICGENLCMRPSHLKWHKPGKAT